MRVGLRLGPPSRGSRGAGREGTTTRGRAPYGLTLALTVTLAGAGFLVTMAVVLLLVHPDLRGLGAFATLVNQQNQNAKTALYLIAFAAILPLALVLAPRLADRIAAGPNGAALAPLTAALAAGLAAGLIVLRGSASLPWGNGLKAVLVGVGIWWAVAGVVLARAARPAPWPLLASLKRRAPWIGWLAGVLVLGLSLCLTQLHSLSIPALVLALLAGLGVLLAAERVTLPRLRRSLGTPLDVVIMVLLLLAIPDVVLYHASSALPNIYFEPGIIQYQHDYILGSVNQLLGGGALLVNVPVSQYGVGLIYFLAGWFHLAPIGYGTFGLLDSLLTALFYIAAYGVLRMVGTGRWLAGVAIAVGVLAFIYNQQFALGALPEQGPLRFGLPMVVIVGEIVAQRAPRYARAARALTLVGLGVASVWALEAFAYTAVTFVAIAAVEAGLAGPGERRLRLSRRLAQGLAACVTAHVLLVLLTLVGTGRLPDWGQYLAYTRAFLLGGQAGAISYGFAHWSPGLALGAAGLASAAGIVLLVLRAPALARRERLTVIALTGSTAFAIAIFSYTDNRSSTYLLPYVALPTLMAGVLWLSLLLRRRRETTPATRRGGLAFALSVAVLLVAAAWPSLGARFPRSALAHAYPRGGLTSALSRLWNSPPIDPRAPEGERLLARYMPARRALILLPTVPDLATEILMRSRRSNAMFIGDPKADSLVPSVWLPKLRQEVRALRPGQRMLIDRAAVAVIETLRAHPGIDPVNSPTYGGWQEEEWLLREIDRRFVLRAIYRDPDGLIVAELAARRS